MHLQIEARWRFHNPKTWESFLCMNPNSKNISLSSNSLGPHLRTYGWLLWNKKQETLDTSTFEGKIKHNSQLSNHPHKLNHGISKISSWSISSTNSTSNSSIKLDYASPSTTTKFECFKKPTWISHGQFWSQKSACPNFQFEPNILKMLWGLFIKWTKLFNLDLVC
jgi:hypothetical protein